MRPENVLLADDGHIVLTGFEQSRFTEPTNPLDCLSGFPTNEMSHLILQAPEVVLGWRYNFKTDLWSYGLLLFYMLSGLVRTRLLHLSAIL